MMHRMPVLSVVTLLLTTGIAHAAFTTPVCLAKKRTAWGNLRKCQATEEAKQLQGKPADLAKCQTKFDAKLAAASDKATEAGVPCRYGDHGDGTVIDYDTGLQWEKKTGCSGSLCICVAGDPHCVGLTYSWDAAVIYVNGTADDPSVLAGTFAGFAGHSDWRLPTIMELQGILDPSVAGCGIRLACVDPIFGVTASDYYWSATTGENTPLDAWLIAFAPGAFPSFTVEKRTASAVRAVRSAL